MNKVYYKAWSQGLAWKLRKLWQLLWPCITICLKFAASSISRVWTYKKYPKYSLRPQIKYLYFRWIWQILVEAKRISLNYSCFWTFMGSKSNNYSTLMHVTRTTQIKIRLINLKRPNIIWYSHECLSISSLIFASRLNTWTSNHHFLASPTIQFRLQRFAIASMTNLEAGPASPIFEIESFLQDPFFTLFLLGDHWKFGCKKIL